MNDTRDPAEVAAEKVLSNILGLPLHEERLVRTTKIIREAYAEQTTELAKQISRAEDAEEEATTQAGELVRLRAFVVRCQKWLAGKVYDPDMVDSLARVAAEAAKEK